MKVKFFGSFQVLHPVGIQAYKLKLPKQWTINDIFYIFQLEQDTVKKGQVDEMIAEQLKFKAGDNNKEYEVEGICNDAFYARESEVGHLLVFYYLIS